MKGRTKRLLAGTACAALLSASVVGGTLAYYTDTDSDVNVMTMGNVQIEQIEQEWNDDGTALKDFTQAKPLAPYVGDLGWTYAEDKEAYRQFAMENAVDKYVSVENTGKSDAYVRTVFAFEMGSLAEAEFDKMIGISANAEDGSEFKFAGAWNWDNVGTVSIGGKNYYVMAATHSEALSPDETTIPSLLQVYLSKDATNETAGAIDGNGNGAYDILVLSQAVQTNGFASAADALDGVFGKVADKAAEWFGGEEFASPVLVSTAAELQTALTAAGAAKAGDTTVILTSDVDLSGTTWTPIKVDGYHGADIVTVDGGGHTITGLSAPLFDGGFAGGSGIVIKNLTIADSQIASSDTQGTGAFISKADSMDVITLENCNLVNSTVNAPDARTGGLVGWTSGYSKQDDGPVKTYVTINNCSVIGCTITGTAVGGINGHAGASDWTYTTITNCTVLNNTLISTDNGDWRVGEVVGTANVGEVTISGIAAGNNTMTQANASSQRADGLSSLVGRFVPGTTGKLTIDDDTITTVGMADDQDGFAEAAGNNDAVILSSGTYTLPTTVSGKTLAIEGAGAETVIDISTATGVNGADIEFSNLTVKTTSTNYTGIQHSGDIVYNNVVFEGSTFLYGDSVTFNNCTFNLTSNYIWTYGAKEVTFNNCTFNTDGKAILVFQDGTSHHQTVTVKDCTFNATAAANTSNGIHVAAVSIDGTNGTYTVNLEGANTVDSDFNGLWQIKAGEANVTVNK